MAEVDYGYGNVDYGYGDAKPDEVDYGYGNAKPDEVDYGYGNAKPDDADYGYGDAKPDDDYGYGDPAPREQAPPTRRPKRRCSVTKYSLEEAGKDSGAPEAEMVQQLHAAEMLQRFRNGGAPTAPQPTYSGYSTDDKSSETVVTTLSTDSEEPAPEKPAPEKVKVEKKAMKGFSKLRKRLSIFH